MGAVGIKRGLSFLSQKMKVIGSQRRSVRSHNNNLSTAFVLTLFPKTTKSSWANSVKKAKSRETKLSDRACWTNPDRPKEKE